MYFDRNVKKIVLAFISHQIYMLIYWGRPIHSREGGYFSRGLSWWTVQHTRKYILTLCSNMKLYEARIYLYAYFSMYYILLEIPRSLFPYLHVVRGIQNCLVDYFYYKNSYKMFMGFSYKMFIKEDFFQQNPIRSIFLKTTVNI